MYNVLYIDDRINYYSSKLNKIVTFKPYEGVIENGFIIDTKKFYKVFVRMLKKESIKSGIIYDKIIIVTPPKFNNVYKEAYKNLFNNLNYKIVVFKSELSFYKLKKNNAAININDKYFYYSYLFNGKIKTKIYSIEDLNFIDVLLKNNQNIYIYGKNSKQLLKKLEGTNKNYYVFENGDYYFINKSI